MEYAKTDFKKIIEYIEPSSLDYSEWTQVGMALKYEGLTASDWDDWSRRDSRRYNPGECFRKWNSFEGAGITGATLVSMAKDGGYEFPKKKEYHTLDWDDEIEDDLVVVDKDWIEEKEVLEPKDWNPVGELIKYLEVLFDSTENVGYVTQTWEKDGKFLPNKGNYDRTAGELIQALNNCDGDIGAVLGDYNEKAGAWIRFNPLDGQGVKNDNVTEFRYALVESDTMELEKQNAILRELELPIAAMLYSGGKSIHAIVKVDAQDYKEYRKRVDYLYNVCEKNGLKVDSQNRNPSRLSRMPGIIRNGKKQFLMETNIGKSSWTEWEEWIEGVNDDLPEPESLSDFWSDLPELSPPLIHGILRQGHKLLLAGPSKAGKSYSLIELCIAIAEGKKWLGFDCAKGKIMYVNLELDRASCLHRFKDVYNSLGIQPSNISNIDIWNLRGKSVPMDKLAPKLIRRAAKKNYIAIVIDPIYKVITGDENSADQMARFCNQFDRVCTDLDSAVIYCHHHSKGRQGGKRSMDRASGSGVFARDPDALLDLIQLETNEKLTDAEVNRDLAAYVCGYLKKTNGEYYGENVGMDDELSKAQMLNHAKEGLTRKDFKQLEEELKKVEIKSKSKTAWRIEGTLREFASFSPINLWFDYPTHKLDDSGVLKDVEPESEKAPWQRAIDKRKSPESKKNERKQSLEMAFEACGIDGVVTANDLAEYLGVTKNTVWRRIKEHSGYEIVNRGTGKESIIVEKEEI